MAGVAKSKAGRSKRSDAHERILSAITFGDLVAGSRIDEKQIARTFGLGLAAVRDALSRLALEGLVERHARIGTRVPELSLRELHEIFEMRVVMEGAAAALAAERATEDDIEALEAAFEGIEAALDARDYRRVVAMDKAFHRRLAAATRNSHIERSVVMLHNNALRFWYFGLARLDHKVIHADIKMHFKVIEAIAARDSEAAARAMRSVLGVFPDNVRLLMFGSSVLEEAHSPILPALRTLQRRSTAKKR